MNILDCCKKCRNNRYNMCLNSSCECHTVHSEFKSSAPAQVDITIKDSDTAGAGGYGGKVVIGRIHIAARKTYEQPPVRDDESKKEIKFIQDLLRDGQCICGVNELGEKTESWHYRKPECPIHGGASAKTMVSDIETKISIPAQDDNDVISDGCCVNEPEMSKTSQDEPDDTEDFAGLIADDKPYNKIDHIHCWKSDEPPCGIKGKHRCCLCEEPIPALAQDGDKLIDIAIGVYTTKLYLAGTKHGSMSDSVRVELQKFYDYIKPIIESRTAERTLAEAREVVLGIKKEGIGNRTIHIGNIKSVFSDTEYNAACDDIARALEAKKK